MIKSAANGRMTIIIIIIIKKTFFPVLEERSGKGRKGFCLNISPPVVATCDGFTLMNS